MTGGYQTLRALVVWSALAVVAGPATAHDDHEHPRRSPQPVAPEVAHRPTALPDRIVLSWTGDPATTQSVTWRTDAGVEEAFAQIAVADHGPGFVAHAVDVAAKSTPLKSDLGLAHYHTATFTDLQPKTKYAYRVGDGVNWSEWSHFTTASDQAEPFSFVYFGDAQNDVKSHWSRIVREAYSDAPKAAFLLHAGDLINRANSDAEWGEWFYASGFIQRSIPCIATPGNHEYDKLPSGDGIERRGLSRHWRPMFAFPLNGIGQLPETNYFIDYQGTRIVSLDSNDLQAEQAAWLKSVLATNPQPWTILTFHHPMYSSKEGRDNTELRKLWQPVFDEYRVDLVLQGHDHTYARTRQMVYEENLPVGVTRKNEEVGSVYVVSVSGPKMYELGRRPFMVRAGEDTQLYQIITVDGDEIRYEARTAIGQLYDAFTLRKRAGQPNELIEQVPDFPERLRTPAVPAAAGP